MLVAMDETKTALFVRVPNALAQRLDERAKASGRSKQDLVTELLGAQTDGSGGPSPDASDVVIDLDEVATLLRVGADDVLARIAEGDFPARRFGATWRFSRAAVLAWLAGSDPLNPRHTGFGPTSQ